MTPFTTSATGFEVPPANVITTTPTSTPSTESEDFVFSSVIYFHVLTWICFITVLYFYIKARYTRGTYSLITEQYQLHSNHVDS
jgi:heme/copper-type cytochrome/quinol oxidase subunit 2